MRNKKTPQQLALYVAVFLPLVLAVSCDAIFGDWKAPFYDGLNNPNDPYVSPLASGSASPTPTPSDFTSPTPIPSVVADLVLDFEDEDLSDWTGAWVISSANAYGGSYSLQSNAIGNSGSTQQTYTIDFVQAGTISFWYKVSSEVNYDYLRFYVDGVQATNAAWSGTVAWAQFSYAVTAGSHTFKWVYSKDSSGIGGSDCAWIDDVSFVGIEEPSTGTGGITVETPSPDPVFTITMDGLASVVAYGSTLDLSATSTVTVDSWEWYLGTTLIGSENPLSVDTTAHGLLRGRTYTITVIGYTASDAASTRITFKVE